MNANPSPLALVTGASSGIGYQLAGECARYGLDLVIVADRSLRQATTELVGMGARVRAVEVDLAAADGIAQLYASLDGRPVDVLIANAEHGLGGAFLDQSLPDIEHLVDANIKGALSLIHQIGRDMRQRRSGRILIVVSRAELKPGACQAVYNGTRAFLDSFWWALRNELQGSGVSVTCLLPGAETEIFERAAIMDTPLAIGQEMDAREAARISFRAMME